MDNSIEAVDRLSSLPDDLIHKILSFVSIRDIVQTIDVLSSRYRHIWATTPYLNFKVPGYHEIPKFSNFVERFLSHRNNQVDVSSMKLQFLGEVTQSCGDKFVKKLMDYASAHNIQRLEVTFLLETYNIEFLLSLFRSMSLKHLIIQCKRSYSFYIYYHQPTFTLEFPALTTLYLEDVILCSDDHKDYNCVGLLFKCPNLKNLTLKHCETEVSSSFSICHPGLSDLTLDDAKLNYVKVVNVVAPQLENLTIRCNVSSREHVISSPNLASLAYRGANPLLLNSTDGFRCLKEADILVSCRPNDTDAHQMVCMLQQLRNVEFLTLNLEIIELLSSSVELISHRPSPFVNLKSLTIYPEKLYEWDMKGLSKVKVNLSAEVKSYLLDSSPGATLTMISREVSKLVRLEAYNVRKLNM